MDNPAGNAIGAALPKPPRVQKHYKALPYDEVAGAVATVRRSDARVSVKLGIEFLVLTACWSGEVRGAAGRSSTWTAESGRFRRTG